MHWVRLITFVILPLLLALAAPVLILWAWGNDWPLLPALLAGIMFLAAAIVVHLSGQLSQPQTNAAQEAIWQELHALRQKVDALLAQPRQQAPAPDEKERKTPVKKTVAERREPASPPAEQSLGNEPQRPAMSASAEEALAGFQLYMEPVIDLASGQTALYRAHPALPAEGERIYLGRHAQLRARTLGRAAALQARTVDGALAFAHRLRARGASPGIICPLDVAVLAQTDAAERLQRLLEASAENRKAAEMVYFAVPFNELASTSREARMHLMMLAQSVAGFVIDHDGVLSPDTPLPLPLPVRHVDVPGQALALAAGLSDMEALAGRYAERGWRIIASEVGDVATARQVTPLAALARGAHFSPPRRVREEALGIRSGHRQETGAMETSPPVRMAAAR